MTKAEATKLMQQGMEGKTTTLATGVGQFDYLHRIGAMGNKQTDQEKLKRVNDENRELRKVLEELEKNNEVLRVTIERMAAMLGEGEVKASAAKALSIGTSFGSFAPPANSTASVLTSRESQAEESSSKPAEIPADEQAGVRLAWQLCQRAGITALAAAATGDTFIASAGRDRCLKIVRPQRRQAADGSSVDVGAGGDELLF